MPVDLKGLHSTVRQYHTYFNQVGTTGLVAFSTSTSSTAFENWTLMGCSSNVSNNGISCTDTAVAFYAPMALGPGTPNTLYFGSDRLYRSTNQGTTMTVVSQAPLVSGVFISAIGISPQNDNVRIVGLANGRVYATTAGSTTLTNVTGTIPARYVSRAVIDPNNQNTAYVTLASYFGNMTAHIYKTTTWQAQTFTPSSSGRLDQVDFQSALSTTSTADTLVVEIRNVVSGAPGAVLATANISTISGTGNAWYTVNFSSPTNVTAGTQYAIVFRAASGGPYRLVRANGNVYAGGAWLQSSNSGGSWATVTSGGITQDLAFRTYVQPLIYATSGTLVSSPKDANQADGTAAWWATISWNATTPADTDVKFQAAAGNNAAGLFTFVGPDGTPSTYFTNGGSLSQFNGFRYLKYKAFLSTTNTALTPTLADVTVCNSNTPLPATSLSVAPASGVYGTTTTLTATLTAGGSPLAGKPVVFKLNGANFGGNTATTDANGVATIPNVSLAGLNAGTYTGYVTARYASDLSYAGSNGVGDLTVEKATPVINWSNSSAIIYGMTLGASQLNATATRGVGGPVVAGIYVYAPAAGTVLNVGNGQTLHVDFTPSDAVNYTAASKDVTINIVKATLTIKTVDSSKVYGQPNPAFAVTYSGFLNGDGPGSLGGALTFTTAATQSSNAGVYTVTPSGLTSANYAINFVAGSLTINKAPLTVTANNATKLLGAANPTFTASYSGFVLGQGPSVLGGTLTFTTPATTTSPVGNYPVTPSGLTSNNYAITYVNGTLSVTYGVCVQYDTEKAANSGSTIPVKLQLCNAASVNVSSTAVVLQATGVIQVPSNAPAQLNDAGNSNPNFLFNYTGGTYHFNLKTKGYAPGTYLLNFTVSGDPVPHSTKFSVR